MSGEMAGALDRRVTLLRRAADRDDLGGAAGEWFPVATIWAGLAPIPPAAWGGGDRPVAPPRWRGTIRAGIDVSPGDRLEGGAMIFAVRAVQADPATPDRLTLTLEENR